MFLSGNDNKAYLYLLQGFIGPPYLAWLEGGQVKEVLRHLGLWDIRSQKLYSKDWYRSKVLA